MNLTTRLYVANVGSAEYHSKTGMTRMDLVTLKK